MGGRVAQPGCGDVGQRDAHEGARQQLGVGDAQPGLIDDRVFVQQQVQVDGPGRPGVSRRPLSPQRPLDLQTQDQEIAGPSSVRTRIAAFR